MKRSHQLRRIAAPLAVLLALALVPAWLWAAEQRTEIVCIQCHGALPGKLGEPVKQWRRSIHAENGIACDSCHGGQPHDAANAMNRAMGFLGAPKEREIPAFCGRCHVGVMKDYLISAHGRALGRGGPSCVTCHSNHYVTNASLAIINEKTCSQCHTFERARIIKDAMQHTEDRVVHIDARITGYKGQGIDTEGMEKGLFGVRNRFHSLFHEVNVEKVKGESTAINTELDKLDRELAAIETTQHRRKVAGAVAVCGALLLAGLVYLFKKTYDRETR